jgi:Subtilase family
MGVGHGMVRFRTRLVPGAASGCLALALPLCLGLPLAAPAGAHSVSHALLPPAPPSMSKAPPDPYAHAGGDGKEASHSRKTEGENGQNTGQNGAHEHGKDGGKDDPHHGREGHHDPHSSHETNGGSKEAAISPPPRPPPTALHPTLVAAPMTPAAPVPVAPGAAPTSTVSEAVTAILAAPAATSPQTRPGPAAGMMMVGAPIADGKSPAASAGDGKKAADANPHAPAKAHGSARPDLAPTIGTFRPNQVLAHSLSVEARSQLSAQQNYRVETGLAGDVTRLMLPDYLSAAEELVKLQARFPDESFGLNFKYLSYRGAGEGGPAPNLPHKQSQGGCDAARCYGPAMIGWRPELAACARNVVVGIIDTGLDRTHSAVKRLNLIQHPADARRRSDNWHGTGVAALLAGAPDSSTPGLMPDAMYVVVDAFFTSRDEPGTAGEREAESITDTDHLLWALETLHHHRAQVVNMSLVGPSDPAVHAAIRRMAHAGTVFVAAAGNGGPAGVAAFPAAYAEVIAVTAVDRNRHSYAEANHGTYIDVAAPGVRVWTAFPGERQGFLSGTSFAAPFVTAIAAATYGATPMKAAGGDRRRTFNPKQEVLGRLSVERLGGGGEAGTRDSIFGYGLAQAPASCTPASRPDAVTIAERDPPKAPAPKAGRTPWQTQVHRASASRPEPSGQ